MSSWKGITAISAAKWYIYDKTLRPQYYADSHKAIYDITSLSGTEWELFRSMKISFNC